MGLAPYGKLDPELHQLFRRLIKVRGLELVPGLPLDEEKQLYRELQARRRLPERPPIEAADIAFTGQQVFAEIMRELLLELHSTGLSQNLVVGGGCALNSSYSGKILDETPFRALHVPSAPADDGNAVGAAWLAWRQDHPTVRRVPRLLSPYLGSSIASESYENVIRFGSGRHVRHLPGAVVPAAARLLAEGKIIGWMQGRAEFGPRALGSRSILADPRAPEMKDRINGRVKFREEYRPFAPAILHEHGPAWFEHYQHTPYMERTLRFRPEVRACVPAVVHEDGTGRLQSVTPELAPKYYELISAFYAITGVPIVLNTSFNIMGKPIIHSVEDAVGMFYTTGLDALVIDDLLMVKDEAMLAAAPRPPLAAG
jgi:carbamoyltransferase